MSYVLLDGKTITTKDKKIYIGDRVNRKCRFCNKTNRETVFGKKLDSAHALPEMIGNRTLFTLEECTDCNKIFGQIIETDFGNFFKPEHNLFRIEGKKKERKNKDEKTRIPIYSIKETMPEKDTLKETTRISWRNDGLLHECMEENSNHIVFDLENKLQKIKYEVDSFIPIAVFKCFVKMALTVMPRNELANFTDTINWIRSEHHMNFYNNRELLLCSFFLIEKEECIYPEIHYAIWKNDMHTCTEPHMLFQVSWGSYCYLIEIPVDRTSNCKTIAEIPPPPSMPYSRKIQPECYNLTSNIVEKGYMKEFTVNFENYNHIVNYPHEAPNS